MWSARKARGAQVEDGGRSGGRWTGSGSGMGVHRPGEVVMGSEWGLRSVRRWWEWSGGVGGWTAKEGAAAALPLCGGLGVPVRGGQWKGHLLVDGRRRHLRCGRQPSVVRSTGLLSRPSHTRVETAQWL